MCPCTGNDLEDHRAVFILMFNGTHLLRNMDWKITDLYSYLHLLALIFVKCRDRVGLTEERAEGKAVMQTGCFKTGRCKMDRNVIGTDKTRVNLLRLLLIGSHRPQRAGLHTSAERSRDLDTRPRGRELIS